MPEAVEMRRSERREREHAMARTSILAAARRLAARDGANGLTLRGVAAEAGYAPAALYGYFRNRTDLILALAAEDLAQLSRTMRAAHELAGSMVPAASAALNYLTNSETIAAAASALDASVEAGESERLFNGRLIGVLRTLSEIAGGRSGSRAGQCDVLLIAAALAGLVLLVRSGRLKALGFAAEELLVRLDARFSPAPQAARE